MAAIIEAFLAGLVGAVVALRLKGYLENRVEEPAEDRDAHPHRHRQPTVGIGISKDLSAVDKTYKINTEKNKSSDEYAMTLNMMFKEIPVTAVIISSVVPEPNDVFREYFQAWYDITPIFLGAGVKTGIRILSDNPREVGSDLIANAVAATEHYAKTCLIVDLDGDDVHLRGESRPQGRHHHDRPTPPAETPSSRRRPNCRRSNSNCPTSLIGTTSIDSIKSGIVYGHASMIDGIIGRIERRLPATRPCRWS
ncbi:MAG: type III pantothenate kinase [Comamonadaceae bacterium]|nr:type III pantothenate kinase [Comamonadaceae bacterium]